MIKEVMTTIHDLKSKLNIETFNQEMININNSLDNKIDKGTVITHEDFLDNENITVPDSDILNRLNTVENNSNKFQQDVNATLETNLELFKQELEKKADKKGIISSEPFMDNDTFEFEDDIISRLNRIEQNMITSLDI